MLRTSVAHSTKAINATRPAKQPSPQVQKSVLQLSTLCKSFKIRQERQIVNFSNTKASATKYAVHTHRLNTVMYASKAIKAKTVSPKNQALTVQEQLAGKCVSYTLSQSTNTHVLKKL